MSSKLQAMIAKRRKKEAEKPEQADEAQTGRPAATIAPIAAGNALSAVIDEDNDWEIGEPETSVQEQRVEVPEKTVAQTTQVSERHSNWAGWQDNTDKAATKPKGDPFGDDFNDIEAPTAAQAARQATARRPPRPGGLAARAPRQAAPQPTAAAATRTPPPPPAPKVVAPTKEFLDAPAAFKATGNEFKTNSSVEFTNFMEELLRGFGSLDRKIVA